MSRYQYVWRLKVVYPEGSHEKGWRPAIWDDPEFVKKLPRDERRALRHREFRWPRERVFLSSSGAWWRAAMLLSYGAEVKVERSERIRWSEEPATEQAISVTDEAAQVCPVPVYQGWREELNIPRFGADEVFLCGCRKAVTGAGLRTSAGGSPAAVSSVISGSGQRLRLPGCVLNSSRAYLSRGRNHWLLRGHAALRSAVLGLAEAAGDSACLRVGCAPVCHRGGRRRASPGGLV